jgi:hypothetical protein
VPKKVALIRPKPQVFLVISKAGRSGLASQPKMASLPQLQKNKNSPATLRKVKNWPKLTHFGQIEALQNLSRRTIRLLHHYFHVFENCVLGWICRRVFLRLVY